MYLHSITQSRDLRTGLLIALDDDIFFPPWSMAQWKGEVDNPSNRVSLISADLEGHYLTGFLSIGLAHKTVELKKIGVLPAYRRNEVATFALNSTITHYRDINFEDIIAEVAITNHSAICFYEKLGFYRISRRKKYFQGKIDALVLQKEL